ncbi:hypothetical protein [Terasakiella sp.]|uniref:hypothetical protein n=1 Tax=Terasakiella sp. TaxID=2034861 RepID=UPI003AA7C787
MSKEVKPLFLPLKGLYFDLFSDGRKTYELRRLRGGWNLSQVYVGRDVVLSYGYGKKYRKEAMILAVKSANSIGELISKHSWLWRQINPLADSPEAMISSAIDLMGDGPVIAFEPSFDTLSPAECPRCNHPITCWDGLDIGSRFDCPYCSAPLKAVGDHFIAPGVQWPVFHTAH